MKKVKVAIIGAGSGGLSARREVAKKTDDYIVIDGGKLGTTCARVGCMPSKVLIQVANDFHRRNSFEEEGISGYQDLAVDTKHVMKHVRKLRDRFVRGVMGGMESWSNEKLVRGYAKFTGPNELEVNDQKITAEKIIVASGSTPFIPDVLKPFEKFLITTDEFFELEDLPKSAAVVGLGVIGLELGQAMHRLGVETVGIARRENLSGITDPVINSYTIKKFKEEMNLSFAGIQSAKEVDGKLELTSGDQTFKVDKVLVTTGRAPVWDRLNISSLPDLELDRKGVPLHSANTFQLKNYSHIFMAGDNSGENQILHEASDEGKIAGYNAVNPLKGFKRRCPLMVTFCDPNIVFVGEMYQDLLDRNCEFGIGEVSFEGQGRSIVKLKEKGHLRVYGDKTSGKLLGAELFAPEGEHLGHLLSWAISKDMTVNEVLSLPFYHPVIEEGLRTALRNLRENVNEQVPELEIYPLV